MEINGNVTSSAAIIETIFSCAEVLSQPHFAPDDVEVVFVTGGPADE
jgi:hypothetical protein